MPTILQKVLDNIVTPAVGFLFVLALLLFMWGIVQMIMKSDSEEARTDGKQHMMWGVIGMFIMFAVYGIIALIKGTIGA